MTTPEQDLERALRQRAARAGGTPLSLESVQRRAGRLRRRRTALTVAAAAVAVAVVAPVGLVWGGRSPSPEPPFAASADAADSAGSPGDASAGGVPTYSVVADPPADQTTGGTLPVPYWDDGAVVAPDGTSVRVGSASPVPVDDLVRDPGGGWAGLQQDDEGGLRVAFDDSGSILAANRTASSSIGVTPDGSQYAYLADQASDGSTSGSQLVTRAGADPMTWAVPGEVTGDSGVAGLLADGTVVVTADHGRVLLARSSGSLDDLPGDYLKATSVATATGRIAVQTSYRDDGTSCWAVVDPSGERQARTCRWQLLQFSPDGRHLLGADSQSDGLGPGELVMLDAATLRPVARFTAAAGGHFGPGVWSGSTVLTTVWIDGTWHVEELSADGVRQVRGLSDADPDGVRAPVRFGAGPLAG